MAGVISCGPNEPTEGDMAMVEAFARFLRRELTLDQYEALCATMDVESTQERPQETACQTEPSAAGKEPES